MIITGRKTIFDLIKEKRDLHPKKVFLYYEDECVTYEELLTTVIQTANYLKSKNVKKGDKVAILLSNRPEFYYLWFAGGAIGAVLVPINTASTPYEIEYFIDHSDAVGFIGEKEWYSEKIMEVVHSKNLFFDVTLDEEWKKTIAVFSKEVPEEEVSPEDVCCMMYTSGTTSKPKGVEITHENYIFGGESSVRTQWLTPNDRYLIFLPLFHANSQYYTSMASLVMGCSVVLLKRFSSSTFWDQVQRYQPTVSSFVAAAIKILLQCEKHPNEKSHTLRQAGYGLFVTAKELDDFESRFGVRLFQWYGMTETIATPVCTPLYEPRLLDETTGIVSIGKPALGFEVKIVDDNGQEVGPNQVGEIIVKSPSLMKGYYKNQDATNKTIRDGWLYTGDNGYYKESGHIWFVDRSKDMIKRAGENISSIEVENVIRDHPNVEDCSVIAVPDHLREEAVAAFVKILKGKNLTEEELKTYCQERLSYFKVPQIYKFVEDFPRTSIGKIQKNLLRLQD